MQSLLLLLSTMAAVCWCEDAAEPLRCIVQPTQGAVLETSFLLGCTGGNSAEPLLVYLGDDSLGGPYKGRLVHVLPGPGAYRVKLPMGDPERGYRVQVRVQGAHSPVAEVAVGPPRQCEPLAQLVATPAGQLPEGEPLHPTLSLVAVAASYAYACGQSAAGTAALLLPLLDRARMRTPLHLEHGAEALHALGVRARRQAPHSCLRRSCLSRAKGLSPDRQLRVSRLASRWADGLRSRGLLRAPQEPRLSASVALLRAVATLHRNALRASGQSSCHRGPARAVSRCLVMDTSPFPCADDTLLNTQFVMVKRSDGRSDASVVELFLRKLNPERDAPASRAHATRGLVTLHRLDVPAAAAGFDLLVHLEPERPIDLLQEHENALLSLLEQVTFSAGREPTDVELLRSPGPDWRGNRTLVPRLALGARPLFVAVRLKLEWGVGALRPADPERIRYRLWTALVACRSWRRPAWSGTRVSRGVRERHLLVSSCVLALWLLYGAVLLWARRADQRDEVYNTVTDLQQNLPTDQQPYIVTIITGFRRNAGTTSKVLLQLVGSEGSSRTFLLKDENVNPGTLQRKSEDYFLATTERALGEITEASRMCASCT
ncbi:hypothetical protein HPB48_005862 [Haemaphysalis longicornis]|uniref:PLAT domain-containing protein n=1 Tax=Haemaphysalis longicornis TaxID=44386 RepID=A0A9J6GMM9_HAELO|nr:hypothetical protein HPB48_005862 [Haemaphysalis longicornis]